MNGKDAMTQNIDQEVHLKKTTTISNGHNAFLHIYIILM